MCSQHYRSSRGWCSYCDKHILDGRPMLGSRRRWRTCCTDLSPSCYPRNSEMMESFLLTLERHPLESFRWTTPAVPPGSRFCFTKEASFASSSAAPSAMAPGIPSPPGNPEIMTGPHLWPPSVSRPGHRRRPASGRRLAGAGPGAGGRAARVAGLLPRVAAQARLGVGLCSRAVVGLGDGCPGRGVTGRWSTRSSGAGCR